MANAKCQGQENLAGSNAGMLSQQVRREVCDTKERNVASIAPERNFGRCRLASYLHGMQPSDHRVIVTNTQEDGVSGHPT